MFQNKSLRGAPKVLCKPIHHIQSGNSTLAVNVNYWMSLSMKDMENIKYIFGVLNNMPQFQKALQLDQLHLEIIG